MGKGQKTYMLQFFLRLSDCNIVEQMPALIENVVHDTHIHVFEVPHKVLCNHIGLFKKVSCTLPEGAE